MKDEIVQAVSQLLAARVSVHVSDLSTPFATKRHLLCVLLNPRMGAMGPLAPMGPAMPMPMPGSRFREKSRGKSRQGLVFCPRSCCRDRGKHMQEWSQRRFHTQRQNYSSQDNLAACMHALNWYVVAVGIQMYL